MKYKVNDYFLTYFDSHTRIAKVIKIGKRGKRVFYESLYPVKYQFYMSSGSFSYENSKIVTKRQAFMEAI